MSMRAMILAAGRGERMRPLTDVAPKPLLPAGGKPLIQYHIEALAAAGVRDIVINLAWKGDMIRDTLGDGGRFGVDIAYTDEGDSALETGGGIFGALPLLGSAPFIVVSGDIWTDYRFGTLATALSSRDLAHFVLVPNPSYHSKGDFGLDQGRVLDRGERFTYANIGMFSPAFFEGCRPGRFALAPLMFARAQEGRTSGELYSGRWFNVGTPAQLQHLHETLSNAR
jgi:N-acetyl-alpha-D-muramate 1-phosphate uridylyltransferase